MDQQEFLRYKEAADRVCIECVENTLEHPEVCDSCPVRKSYEMISDETGAE